MRAGDIEWGQGARAVDRSAWPFTITDKGKPHSNLHNIGVVLDHEPTLAGVAWYDEFLDRILTGPTAREWADHDDVTLAMRLQDEFGLIGIRPGMVREVLDQRVRATPRHCVRAWLQSHTWDGVSRIDLSFEEHWGAQTGDTQPEAYVRAASRNFFIGLVARILKPGCKLDTMVVFEGPQGQRKSSALEALGGPWFSASHESLQHKDFFQVLQGQWLVEIPELDTFGRADVTRIKSVLSTRIDRYRASYARTATDHPRQGVFAGTANRDDWGRDETGLRRFWPIKVGDIRIDLITALRGQLFAEAVYLFRQGATWWEMPSAATLAVQADRQSDDSWSDLLTKPRFDAGHWSPGWLTERTETTIAEVMRDGLKLTTTQMSKAEQMRVARLLTLEGWDKVDGRLDGEKVKFWRKRPKRED